MKKSIGVGVFVLALMMTGFVATGCGANYSTPEETMKAYVEAHNSEDFDGVADCMVKDEQKGLADEMKAAAEAFSDEDIGEVTWVFKEVKESGGWTIGVVELKTGDSEEGLEIEHVLVKEGDLWKISDAKTKEYVKEKIAKMFSGDDADNG